uniref:Uncharacterized protein n=1 Tax=Triticum urartu TaxID=4572 RepID=A0A8R7K2Q0_TRIUA
MILMRGRSLGDAEVTVHGALRVDDDGHAIVEAEHFPSFAYVFYTGVVSVMLAFHTSVTLNFSSALACTIYSFLRYLGINLLSTSSSRKIHLG